MDKYEKAIERNRQYYKDNKKRILEMKKSQYWPTKVEPPKEEQTFGQQFYRRYYRNRKWHCDVCDKELNRQTKPSHLKTKLHLKNLENNKN